MSLFKPLLAADGGDAKSFQFPVLASPKLDGIRCIVREGKARTRSMKMVPNKFVCTVIETFSEQLWDLDGELMIGDEFNATTSGIMSHDGEPDFTFHVFDTVTDDPFDVRFASLASRDLPNFCRIVPHVELHNMEQLQTYYEGMLENGLEGVMLRHLKGRYKQGRSTLKEGILIKLKPFKDSEARILGFEELMHNENEQTINELGFKQRSSEKAGLVGANTLGKFLVVGTEPEHFGGVEFSVGSGRGLTHALRQEIWNNREAYLGKCIKFKYQQYGSIDKPRTPIFLGFREPGT